MVFDPVFFFTVGLGLVRANLHPFCLAGKLNLQEQGHLPCFPTVGRTNIKPMVVEGFKRWEEEGGNIESQSSRWLSGLVPIFCQVFCFLIKEVTIVDVSKGDQYLLVDGISGRDPDPDDFSDDCGGNYISSWSCRASVAKAKKLAINWAASSPSIDQALRDLLALSKAALREFRGSFVGGMAEGPGLASSLSSMHRNSLSVASFVE